MRAPLSSATGARFASRASRTSPSALKPPTLWVSLPSLWCTEKQTVKLMELLKYNLRPVRAHLLREDFQRFWEYKSAWWAGKFLDEWTDYVMRSKLEPMKKVAMSIRNHRPLVMNWFRAKGQLSSGAVEGLNNKVKLVTRKSYGFRTAEVAKQALLHNLGHLPEPKRSHRFC